MLKFLKPSFFRHAKDHWIPYRLALPDENIDEFSHQNYTELVFNHQPTNIRLEREFNNIIFNDNGQGLKLVKSLWERLEYDEKEKFYMNFSLLLSEIIAENSKKSLVNFMFPPDRGKARAEMYKDKLEMLFNDHYLDFRTNQNDLQAALVNNETISIPANLIWKGSKVQLYELMDALYRCKVIDATQQQILDWLNKMFATTFDIVDFQKAMSEVRNERMDKAKFLRWLTKNYEAGITRKKS